MLKNNKTRAIGIVLVILLVFVISFAFYKTFCTLKQIVDWNAVSAIATALAVFVAIYIPQKERLATSKMELFTQRFEAYYAFRKNLSDMYTGSWAKKDIDVINLSIQKCIFLIEEKDKKMLDDILQRVIDKIEMNNLDGITPDVESNGIDNELEDLFNVFEKYLAIRDYGIK